MVKCLICGKEFIPEGNEPIQPVVQNGEIVFRYIHKECYNKKEKNKIYHIK